MAVTMQTGEVEHAITSVCPWRKASVLEALRKKDIRCGEARLGCNDTVSGQVNLGAKSRNPLISKLATAEKCKKGESEGCPDHRKVVIPQSGVQNWLNSLQNPRSNGLTKNA